MITPSPYLDTDGLTKARKQHVCDYCKRKIEPGDLYQRHHANGPRNRCIVCVTFDQMYRHITLAKDLRRWLEKRSQDFRIGRKIPKIFGGDPLR